VRESWRSQRQQQSRSNFFQSLLIARLVGSALHGKRL
jgi:hypothetical protein